MALRNAFANLALDQSLTGVPSFLFVADRIVPAANKYLLSIFNTSSTRKAVIQRIWVINWQVASVAAAIIECEIRRISARTAGTDIPAFQYDTSDAISAGITADSGSTVVTDGALWGRAFVEGNEVNTGLTIENFSFMYSNALIYERQLGTKGITLRQNQGLTLKQISSVTAGSVSAMVELTDETA
jgi:hypothetical protein